MTLPFTFVDGNMSDDKNVIEAHGGPAKLAKKLGYAKQGGVQRVQNWTTRGIPPKVKLAHPDLFLVDIQPGSSLDPSR